MCVPRCRSHVDHAADRHSMHAVCDVRCITGMCVEVLAISTAEHHYLQGGCTVERLAERLRRLLG